MRKKNLNTTLELLYKNVSVCKVCDEKYGHDSNIPKYELCPICSYALSISQRVKKGKV